MTTTLPGTETVKVLVTGTEDGAPPRLQITFLPAWQKILPGKFDVSGTFADKLVLTPSPDDGVQRHRSKVDRYPNGICRVSLHVDRAGRHVELGSTIHVGSVTMVDEEGTLELVPVLDNQPKVLLDVTVVKLKAAVEALNEAIGHVPGATLRVEDNRARVTIEI